MSAKPYREILDSVAAAHMPADFDVLPHLTAQLERKTLMQTLRARPMLALIIVVLALLVLTGVAYAVGNLLGYVPGVGLVDRSAPLRVLAAPVSQTRDGITLTVGQALLSADKSVLSLKVAGVPQSAYPKDEASSGCLGRVDLRLPDGTLLPGGYISGGNWGTFDSRLSYGPIPAKVEDATLLVACIGGTNPGALPDHWQIPLHFVPAPPDLTVVPVIEVATPAPVTPAPALVTQMRSDPFLGITLDLNSMLKTDRGYILTTSIRWDPQLARGVWADTTKWVALTDAAGKKIDLLPLDTSSFAQPLAANDPNSTVMLFSMPDVPFAAPLTLTINSVGIDLAQQPHFTFDPGTHPQPGQEWQVDQHIQVLDYPVRVTSARFVPRDDIKTQAWARFIPSDMDGLAFTLESDPALQSLSLTVASGFAANGTGTSAYSGRDAAGKLTSYALWSGDVVAPLGIMATSAQLEHVWKLTWDPAAVMTEAPPASGAPMPDFALTIEKVVPVDDGYYLIGRTTWDDPRFSDVGIGGSDAQLLGADGTAYPLEPADFSAVGVTRPEPGQWIYKVYGKVFPATLTLRMTKPMVQFTQPYTLSFDPGADPHLGQEWQIGQTLDILGYKANVISATFVKEGDLHGFEFHLTTDPQLDSVPLYIRSGISGGNGAGGGGPSPRDPQGGMIVSSLTDAQFSGPVLLAVPYAVFSGTWETTWSPPPAPAGATPVKVPEACVRPEQWQQVWGGSAALPAGLAGRVLLLRGALSPDPSVFVSNLDGSDEQTVAFGTWTGFGPGGKEVYYKDENDQLMVYDLAARRKSLSKYPSIPFWSPDAGQVAFQGANDPYPIFVMNADGTQRRQVLAAASYGAISGWTPDGRKLLFVDDNQDQTTDINLLDLATGSAETILNIKGNGNGTQTVALSPDGQWLAYLDHVIGKTVPGLYLSHLDGSGKRLLLQSDTGFVSQPVWSPDGHWLAATAGGNDPVHPDEMMVLINVETCQVLPLSGLKGNIQSWVQP